MSSVSRSLRFPPCSNIAPGLSKWLSGKESACKAGDGFSPWVGKIPWRRAWQPTPVFLPGESPWTEEPGKLQSMGSQRLSTYAWVCWMCVGLCACVCTSRFGPCFFGTVCLCVCVCPGSILSGSVCVGWGGVSPRASFCWVCVLGWCVSAHLRELGLTRLPPGGRAVPRAEVTHPPISSFSWEPAWESE